jgi:RimJ/RimL family protein N-acetyltransferase
MSFGYCGPRVRLVPLDRAKHFENCIRWMNDTEVTDGIALVFPLVTSDRETDWFDHLAKTNTDAVFAIETLEGEHIGNSGIHGIDFRLGIAKTGSLIGEGAYRGQGLGTEAAHLRAYYAFEILGLRMLYSEYYPHNHGSANMQRKIGAEIWGVQPGANFKRGHFVDVVHTWLSRERWRDHAPDWIKDRLHPLAD